LSDPPYRSGDFVWAAFPERENPARPGPRHIAYAVAITSGTSVNAVIVAYTTSQPWSGPRPPGVYGFGRGAAAEMGQARPFTLDLRRMAFVPMTVAWFPDLAAGTHGIVGRAPERLRLELELAAKELFRRSPEIVERLGPLWPTP
jgi:hypothetical protein